MILCARNWKNRLPLQIEKQNWNLGTVCSDTSGTDCSDSMVPITTLRVVPIQRYRHIIPHYKTQDFTGAPHWVTCIFLFALYIFWFLHQTTTVRINMHLTSCCISFDSYIKPQLNYVMRSAKQSCISFDSYIKPQLNPTRIVLTICCISFDSYIKPQRQSFEDYRPWVVYLLIPTSNHNCCL